MTPKIILKYFIVNIFSSFSISFENSSCNFTGDMYLVSAFVALEVSNIASPETVFIVGLGVGVLSRFFNRDILLLK